MLVCNVDNMIWGENGNFKIIVIDNLEDTFIFGSEKTKAFTYLGMQAIQNDDFSLTINQNSYIDCISEISLSNERLKENNGLLCNKEKSSYRRATGQLNWVARSNSSRLIYVNKIKKNVKNSKNETKLPQLNLTI